MRIFKPTSLILCVLAIGCEIADEDRCAGEYEWDKDLRQCVIIEDEVDTGEERDTQANGVGALCYEDADCEAFEADVCLYNPQDPDGPSMCTIWGCVPEDCSGQFECCDCTMVETELMETETPFCIPEDQVQLITSIFPCLCE